MRKFASIQKINSLSPIPEADLIEKAQVLGWNVVVKKQEFKVGDFCVYFEIDSLLPEDDIRFEFMQSKHFRIKTIKLKGQISQGLALPVNLFPEINNIIEGLDVSDVLRVVKYEPPDVDKFHAGNPIGNFPSFLRVTDEVNIQANPDFIKDLKNQSYFITLKMEGTSGSIYYNKEEFGVCSRRLRIKQPEFVDISIEEINSLKDKIASSPEEVTLDEKRILQKWSDYKNSSVYWKIAEQNDLSRKMIEFKKNICLQGEICGPGIQKNILGLKQLEFYVFDVFFIDEDRFANFDEFMEIVNLFGLKTAPLVEQGESFEIEDINSIFAKYENLVYENGHLAEGVVIRSKNAINNERISFKVKNKKYLLKVNHS